MKSLQLLSMLTIALALFMAVPAMASEQDSYSSLSPISDQIGEAIQVSGAEYSEPWSLRGDIDASSVNNFYGNEVSWARGDINAHYTDEKGGFSGYARATLKMSDGSRETVSVNWKSNGNNYGGIVLIDNQHQTVLLTDARIIRNGQISYGNQVFVMYFKDVDRFYVYTDGLIFRVDDVDNLRA